MDSHVAQLVEMGFDARAATAALHDHPRFDDALNFLMTNPGWMPGVLHATSSTPSDAVVAYEVQPCLMLSLIGCPSPPTAR